VGREAGRVMAAPATKRAVVLLSGGLDSATCLAWARGRGFECHTLAVDYGQRHRVELDAARRVATALGAAGHCVVAVDLRAIGARTLTLDCDVLQADGGTRTAAITGGWVALALAVRSIAGKKNVLPNPIRRSVAAVSVGIVDGQVRLDLDYDEDSTAEVDMNVVATGEGELVEVQGTAEGKPFPRSDLDRMLEAALAGLATLRDLQLGAVGGKP